jgi:hypothetical protein
VNCSQEIQVLYFEEAQDIWKNFVPPSGQAATVQGELLRAIEKLRDEAMRNGNGNWAASTCYSGILENDFSIRRFSHQLRLRKRHKHSIGWPISSSHT